MNCKDLTELVTEYLEKRMPEAEAERFREHMKACEVCFFYLRQMELTVEALGKVPAEPIPAEAREAFRNAFLSWKKDKKS